MPSGFSAPCVRDGASAACTTVTPRPTAAALHDAYAEFPLSAAFSPPTFDYLSACRLID
jgi:hypothetical protein